MLKILKGELIGSVIKTSRSEKVRPVSRKVREQFFDIIGDSILNSEFLDLFAGTGVMGLEAISRGAAYAVLVEKYRGSYRKIKENVSSLKISDRVSVLNKDCLRFLKNPSPDSERFDFIFADPPYSWKDYPGLLEVIRESGLVKSDTGLICFKVHKKVLAEFGAYADSRSYGSGDVNLIFFGGE